MRLKVQPEELAGLLIPLRGVAVVVPWVEVALAAPAVAPTKTPA